VKVVAVLLRLAAAFLGLGELLGVVMYWSYNHAASMGTPLALIVLTCTPRITANTALAQLAARMAAVGVAVILVLWEYLSIGVPYLKEGQDAAVLHFMSFAVACGLGTWITWHFRSWRWEPQ
jgi:hypothetical protein